MKKLALLALLVGVILSGAVMAVEHQPQANNGNQELPGEAADNATEQTDEDNSRQGPPEHVTRGPPAFVADLLPEHVVERFPQLE